MVTYLRRLLCVVVLGGLVTSCSSPDNRDIQKAFQAYQALFIDNGRIVDTGNQNVSHSEGQGYGLLFAVAADDKATFDRVWAWTKTVMQREDKLFHWRYRPCVSKDKNCIDDPNNASDGDLLIAWALLRASEKWGDGHYREESADIMQAMESSLFFETEKYLVMLPGEYGFVEDASVQTNLSYWVFPAIDAMAKESKTPHRWRSLHESGTSLIYQAKFSKQNLPPDWLRISSGTLSLENTVSQEYGFNACRIPLHLVWAGIDDDAFFTDIKQWWDGDNTPATMNLITEEQAEYSMTPGMQAVESAVRHILDNEPLVLPTIDRNMDYYSASLTLLSMVAVMDTTH
ncbi:glycosyl hydrolase family 8 [Alteromonas sp. 1_MG-2023]|uniref:glycosyl hydrolase family 8 n=1 Tax=Alteromonas sp. 1_MG-2023 TaxID=3062669 RepID=UPI0026E486B7|nr:glycosyl hydrolase family 8 [Alteromonas sp. 1_MG-2023]MDO6568219.1 glycosyl hydrolase family 8 [Alteromonas sp. 1_MG-2023]